MAGPSLLWIPKTLELGLTSETCEKYFWLSGLKRPQEGVAVHLCFIPYEAGHVTSVTF